MAEFPLDDLDRSIPDSIKLVMCDLILAWANYDARISQWLILAYGMEFDTGAIFVGEMQTRTKIDKLKALYGHHKNAAAEQVSALDKAHRVHVDTRNAVAHFGCVGHMKSDRKRVVFAPVKAERGNPGSMEVIAIHLEQIEVATKFAISASEKLDQIVNAILAHRATLHSKPA